MKKTLVVLILVTLLSLVFMGGCQTKEFTVEKAEIIDTSHIALSYMDNLSTTYQDRTSGTGREISVVEFISNELYGLHYIPIGKDLEEDNILGVTRFAYNSASNDLKQAYGYNVVYRKVASKKESKGRIIISTQYDNLYSFPTLETKADGAYESGASIAALLTIASMLEYENLDYDIDFIFYGGGSYNWEGASRYFASLNQEEKDNILLSIDLGQIVGGEFNYAYTLDKKTDYGNLVDAVIAQNSLNFSEIPMDKRIANGMLIEDGLYNYFHIGMLNNNLFMMNMGIPTLNILSLNWKDRSFPNRVEIKGSENVYQTGADTYDKMKERVGEAKIKENFNAVTNLVFNLVKADNQENLLTALSTARDQIPSAMGQSSMTNTILTLCLKLLVILALIFIMIRMRKIVQDNYDKYTGMLYNQKNNVENKPIDVFGWDEKKEDKKDKDDESQVVDGEVIEPKDDDDIFSDL